MNLNLSLNNLEGVRRSPTHKDQWRARCPAHADRSPSLSIRQTHDRILLHCHAGCDVEDILRAVGASWGDICPEQDTPYEQALAHGRSKRYLLNDIPAVDYATWIVKLAAADKRAGRDHDLNDRATLAMAVDILQGDPADV
jgi:hypothetical protein